MRNAFALGRVFVLGAAIFLGWSAPASAAEKPEYTAEQKIFAGLLAGRDMAPAVSELLATRDLRDVRSGDPHRFRSDPLVSSYQAALSAATRQALRAARDAQSQRHEASSLTPLLTSLGQLHGRQMLLEARARDAYERVVALNASAEMVARAQKAANSLAAQSSSIENQILKLGELLKLDPDDRRDQNRWRQTLVDLHGVLQGYGRDESARVLPILRNTTLPFQRPLLSAPPLPAGTGVTPTYLQESPAPGGGEDLANTTDAPLSNVILARAAELGNDYVRIYEFVRTEIRTQYYAGAMKGAEATLRSGAGNDVDQASLLIALFRASNVPARYVRGVVQLPVARVGAPLGLNDPQQVLTALSRAGIAHEPVIQGGQVGAVRMMQTWVSIFVPYANYRGVAVDLAGRLWLPLTPAVKSHEFVAGSNVAAAADLNGESFVEGYLRNELPAAPVAALRAELEAYLAANPAQGELADQLPQIALTETPRQLLPSSLPFEVVTVVAESAALESSEQQLLSLQITDAAGDMVMDETISMGRLLDRRVTLSYAPATVDDFNVIREFGGYATVPSYLVRLRPQVKVDGLAITAGTRDLAMGEVHTLDIGVSGPAGGQNARASLTAGSYAAIGLSAQLGLPDEMADETVLADDTENRAARLLGNHLARYATQWDQAEDELAGYFDVAVVRPLPALTLVSTALETTQTQGLITELSFKGVNLDAALRSAEPISRQGAPLAENHWMRIAALQGSFLESAVFEQQWAVEAISADKGLRLAQEQSIVVNELNSANLAAVIGGLSHAQNVLDSIQASVDQGFSVLIPDTEITLNAWTGSTWHVWDPDSGGSGYFLSGAIAGGSTSEEPAEWIIDDIVNSLGNPYGQTPNDDPLSAASIRPLPASDGQVGKAGQPLERDLLVLVTDAQGRPVEGATVTFFVVLGDAELSEGNEVVTNGAGIAAAPVTLGTDTDISPLYVLLESGDEYGTQITENWVTASVAVPGGELPMDFPFIVYTGPADPAELEPVSGSIAGLAGAWVGPVQFRLIDEFGNPVSNQEITFAAGAPVVQCGTSSATPARMFLGNDCDVPFVPGSSACGDSSVTVTSNAFGAYVQIITGDGPSNTRYPIRASADGVPPYDFEAASVRNSLIASNLIITQETLPLGYFGNIIHSAEVGETTPGPRLLSVYVGERDEGDGCINRFSESGGEVSYEVLEGGGAGGVTELGGGNYEVTLPVANTPTNHPVRIRVNGVQRPAGGDPVDVERFGTRVFAVEPSVVGVGPNPVPLNENGESMTPIIVEYLVEPIEFPSTVQVNLLEDGNVIDFKFLRTGPTEGVTAFAAGKAMDLQRTYEVEVVVNPRTTYEVVSDRFEVRLTSAIVKSVRNQGTSSLNVNSPSGGGLVINGQVFSPLRFFNDIDIPNERVCRMAGIVLELTQAASISMEFERLDVSGDPTGQVVEILDNESFSEGSHPVDVSADELGTDNYLWRITAVSELDGHVDTVVGGAGSSYITRNSLPIGHPIVKGVDLATGTMTLSRQDLSVPGLGANLQFNRTYASGTRSEPSVVGAGWSHNYVSRIVLSMCGDYYVTGAAGGAVRFVQNADGFVPLKGYHGSLVRSTEEDAFDFYPRSGVRYHYTRRQDKSWWLDYIEDANGNRTSLGYETRPEAPLLTSVTDATGRQLTFEYEQRNFRQWNGDVMTSIQGPGGISVEYTYDEFGNLISAAREGNSTADSYGYLTGGNIGNANLLVTASDDVMGVTRSYEYSDIMLSSSFGDYTLDIQSSRVDSVTEPDGGQTSFVFTAGPWGMNETASVTDANGNGTTYTMNEYGAAVSIAAPNGTRTKTWETETDVLLLSETDENGRVTSYTYDQYANKTSQTTGRFTTTFSYLGPGSFSPPYIKDRLASSTDARGNTTTFGYNASGNTVSESIQGITATYTYDSNGNRLSATDGNGNVTAYSYDANGYMTSRTDAVGSRWRFVWDIRGRKLSETDPNGNQTGFQYDARDRLIASNLPDGSTRTIDYADGSRRRTETDGRGNAMVYQHDSMVRVTSIRNGLGDTTSMAYDANGNKVSETDFAGRTTTFSYDSADRMTSKSEPEGRVTTMSYDGVGNVLSRTVSGPGGSRTTTYTYDSDLYLQTSRTQSGLATTSRSYDGLGNVLTETDPLGRVKSFSYNALNGRLTADGPLGSGMRWTYDDAGSVLTETTLNTPADRVLRYTYDAANRQVQMIDAEGGVWSTEYDAVGNVTRQVDARGNASTTEYDNRNRKSRIVDASGAVTTFGYDANGNLVEHIQPNGNVRSFVYDALDRKTSEADSLGPVAAFTFDPMGNLLVQTDQRGGAITRTYDDLNRAISVTQPEGQSTTFEYNAFGDAVAETDADGNRMAHTFNALGHRTLTTGPLGINRVFSHDLVGNLLSSADSRGNTTSSAYNDLNQKTSQVDPLYTETYEYDLVGNRTRHVNARGVVSTWRYDRADRLLETTRAGAPLERRQYDASGNLIVLTDANGNSTGFEYDARNLLIRESKPELAITTIVRDAMGDKIVENLPAGRLMTRTFDLRTQKTSETNGEGETTGFEYDPVGNQVAEIDSLGGRWETEYDLADRLVRVTDPLGNTTRYTYDQRNNRLTQTDANGSTTGLAYDARNRITAKTYPDGAVFGFGYDVADNLTSQSQPNGIQMTYAYDALNRQTGVVYEQGAESISVSIEYDENGNMTGITETESGGAGGVIAQTFDSRDRLTLIEDRFGQRLQYAYDENGNRTQLLDNDGQATNYQYDGLNRLVSVAIPGLGTATYNYLPNNLLRRLVYPNGAVVDYEHDLGNRTTLVANRQGGEDVAIYRYTYDANGNRLRQEEENGNGLEVTTYGYDAVDRLTSVTYPERQVDYLLDAVGNRLAEDITPLPAGTTFTRTYNYNSRDQLTNVSDPDGPLDIAYAYDANGNQVGKTENGVVTNFTYDARNRMSRVEVGTDPAVDFEYDHNGMRVAKTVAGNRTQYLYDDLSLLAETNALGNTIARYHYGVDRLLAESRGLDNAYFLNEVLGSPAAITAQDGSLVARYLYDAWGNFRRREGSSEQPFGFTGFQRDDETGLYYAKDRYYDSFTGRFLREDPFRGSIARPPSLHRYLYALGNPTVFVDPDGNESNRQILGIDDDSVQRQIEAGETGFAAAAGYAAKVTGYKVWNFFTAGFVNRHDDRVELYDAGKITASEFHSGTLLDASASVGSIAIGGAVGSRVTGALGTGIRGTVASGAAGGLAGDITVQGSERIANEAISEELGRESIDLKQAAISTATGAGTGLIAQGINNAVGSRGGGGSGGSGGNARGGGGGKANKPATVAESPSKPGPRTVKADNAGTRKDLVADADPGPMNRPVKAPATQKQPVFDSRANRWRDPDSGRFAKAPVDRAVTAPAPRPAKTSVLQQDLTVPSASGVPLKPLVLGQTMKTRVTPVAQRLNAHTYNPKSTVRDFYARNQKQWIRRQIQSGRRMFDIGIQRGRVIPKGDVDFYQIERNTLIRAGYRREFVQTVRAEVPVRGGGTVTKQFRLYEWVKQQ